MWLTTGEGPALEAIYTSDILSLTYLDGLAIQHTQVYKINRSTQRWIQAAAVPVLRGHNYNNVSGFILAFMGSKGSRMQSCSMLQGCKFCIRLTYLLSLLTACHRANSSDAQRPIKMDDCHICWALDIFTHSTRFYQTKSGVWSLQNP